MNHRAEKRSGQDVSVEEDGKGNVTLRLSFGTHAKLKLAAVLTGKTMSSITEEALVTHLGRLNIPVIPGISATN